jgi:hypothetical protein
VLTFFWIDHVFDLIYLDGIEYSWAFRNMGEDVGLFERSIASVEPLDRNYDLSVAFS